MTQRKLAAEIGRLIGELRHDEGSLERAIEAIEAEIADWRAELSPTEQEA